MKKYSIAEAQTIENKEGQDSAYDVLRGKRIMVVDDMEVNRAIVREAFVSAGAFVEEAADGREALNLFALAPNSFDMIFMDISMPEMDGYAATEAIRALRTPRAGTIPIVALTARSYPEDADRSFAAGMNLHLLKPVDFIQLLNIAVQCIADF
ncbi:MAG: response regulator [Gracilibacteraceae bacterium]|jgi:CheY-like chemotaxis protein|nr:response regulator [Gracilibacteraceae bacterium]